MLYIFLFYTPTDWNIERVHIGILTNGGGGGSGGTRTCLEYNVLPSTRIRTFVYISRYYHSRRYNNNYRECGARYAVVVSEASPREPRAYFVHIIETPRTSSSLLINDKYISSNDEVCLIVVAALYVLRLAESDA